MHPEKWRETADPFSLPLQAFRIEKVLGYPHAGNDVFHVEGVFEGQICRAYVKVERQRGADLKNEAETIALMPFSFVPRVLEYGEGEPSFLVTAELPGKRLSQIVGDNAGKESLSYMEAYGRTLALLHGLDLKRPKIKPRRFFEMPDFDFFVKHDLEKAEEFLRTNPPLEASECFVHGDFHYANVLWEDGKLSGVLDYELSGTGVREFDLAWALVLRPGQKFLKAQTERECFLSGYANSQSFSLQAFIYYYILISCHFYPLGDEAYQTDLKQSIDSVLNRSSF